MDWNINCASGVTKFRHVEAVAIYYICVRHTFCFSYLANSNWPRPLRGEVREISINISKYHGSQTSKSKYSQLLFLYLAISKILFNTFGSMVGVR